jgi:hypothetical protein
LEMPISILVNTPKQCSITNMILLLPGNNHYFFLQFYSITFIDSCFCSIQNHGWSSGWGQSQWKFREHP